MEAAISNLFSSLTQVIPLRMTILKFHGTSD